VIVAGLLSLALALNAAAGEAPGARPAQTAALTPNAEGCAAARELPAEAAQTACALEALPPPTPAADPRALGAIYERPEFSGARDRTGDALALLLRRFNAWLEGLFGSRGALGYAEGTRVLVLFAAVLAGLAVLARALAARGGRSAGAAFRLAPPTELTLEDPGAHLSRARAAAEPREAIREGLLALLSALERARLARADRVKTNHELVGELTARGASAPVVERVGALLAWYDRAWYSLEPVAPQAAQTFVRDVEAAALELRPTP
jgi:hypothetical protein